MGSLGRSGVVAAALAATVAAAGAVTAIGAEAAAPGCRVSYAVSSQWNDGFTGNVTVTNVGDPLNGWRLTWTYSAGQRITQAWNSTVTQSGAAVTAVNASWNAALSTGGSAQFGFNGRWSGSNPVPTAFALNGVTCNGSSQPTASPQPSPSTSPTRPPNPPPSPTAGPPSPPPNPGTPPAGTVRVYWLRPKDVPYDQRYPDGIAAVMREAQRYYKQELGKTFTLNNPVVEVIEGERNHSWYENTPNGNECYWWVVFNMQAELRRRLNLGAPDRRWINVGEISAEAACSGGGGGSGWVILSGHDADGAAGIGGNMNRWYGGMVHELGHAFGLPDSSFNDGTPMSADFYSYPSTHFNQDQKNRILNGPYGSFLH